MDVATQIEQLEKKRVYAASAGKGQERRHFMERLQAYDYEKQLEN